MKTMLGWGLSVLLFQGGCSSDGDSHDGAGGSGGTAGAGGVGGTAGDGGSDVAWEACPLVTGHDDSGEAQCATVSVPLDWDEPGGKTIDLFIKRRLRAGSAGQLWLLAGGPGQAGSAFESDFASFDRYFPPLDVYMLDHRGTGKSSFLSCPNAEKPDSLGGTRVIPLEIPSCLAELDPDTRSSLPHFNVTNAARDLGHLIERLREPGRPMFVMGVSYGSNWAQRYLALYPDQASAVVLDSTASEGESSYFSTIAGGFDEVGKRLLDRCAQVPECAAHLGADPREAMGEAVRLTDAGHCSEHFTDLRHKAGYLLQTRETRNLVPALIHRVLRCGVQDYAAFSALQQWFNQPQEAALGWSDVLWFNIAVSEYMPIPPPTLQEASDYSLGLWFVQLDPTYFARASAAWPAYPHDEYWGRLPDTNVPVLMLQGGLDSLTLGLAAPLRDHLRGAHQTYVDVPYTTHDVFSNSNLESDPNTTCGGLLIQQFLADPKASLDTSCTGDMQAPTFTADDDLLLAMFGTTDLWGDNPTPTPPLSPQEMANLRDRVQKRLRLGAAPTRGR